MHYVAFLPPSPRGWNWLPVCCLTAILGVIGTLMIHAHMDGRIDPDDLDLPIILIVASLLLSLPSTALAWSGCQPELPGASRRWLKQALLLQAVGLLWSGFIVWAGQLSESFAFDRTLQNAHQVVAAVEEFHLRTGWYPHSLEEVEEDAGRALPRTFFRDCFQLPTGGRDVLPDFQPKREGRLLATVGTRR
jgi:hypothetical protein